MNRYGETGWGELGVLIAVLLMVFVALYLCIGWQRGNAEEECRKHGAGVTAVKSGQYQFICVDGQGRIVGEG